MNQFSTKYGVISNWLCYLLHISTTEELRSNIYETYLLLADEGHFGRCVYLKIPLGMMFCMTTEVLQELHDSINNFGRSSISGEAGKNITTIVKFLLVVCAKLAEVNDLPSKAKLYVLEVFYKCSVDKLRSPFTLMLNQ